MWHHCVVAVMHVPRIPLCLLWATRSVQQHAQHWVSRSCQPANPVQFVQHARCVLDAQEVLNSWFLLGRLGGYNSTNLQVGRWVGGWTVGSLPVALLSVCNT